MAATFQAFSVKPSGAGINSIRTNTIKPIVKPFFLYAGII
jgi:hypothetical protein